MIKKLKTEMKRWILWIGFLLVATLSFGQQKKTTTVAGVYMSWTDYRDGKLQPADNIRLNEFVPNPCIDIVENGKKLSYCKDSIFGYRDNESQVYRFYKSYSQAYRILENKSILIYILYPPKHTSKGIIPGDVPYYFFSISPNSEIQTLSILNLKKAFPDNHEFHHSLDDAFGDGTPLSAYDNENKMYKINYLLNKYLNK